MAESTLVENLLRKKELLEKSDPRHEEIRPALLILGGCMRGVHGAGALAGLHLSGLNNVFDVVVGISVGALEGAYLLAGQVELVLPIFYEKFSGGSLINFTRIQKIIDIDLVEFVMAGGPTKLNLEALQQSRSKFFVGVTEFSTGKGFFLNSKKGQFVLRNIKTSMAVPGLCGPSVNIDGRNYVDGMISLPFPVLGTIKAFNPTDLLIIANRHQRTSDALGFFEKIMMNTLFAGLPAHIRDLIYSQEDRFRREVLSMSSVKNVNILIYWSPDNSIEFLTRDAHKLRTAAQNSKQAISEIFSKRK